MRPLQPDIARTWLAAGLDQVLRNAADIAAGRGSEEHIHQLRIGIRRVRTVLREMMPDERARIEPALVGAFRALGARRDIEHVMQQLEPMLREAGAPALQAPGADASMPSPAACVRSPAFQRALRKLAALAQAAPASPASHRARHARKQVARLLARLLKKTLRDGLVFERLDDERRHRVRKRAKRLRYLAEFAGPLFRAKKARAWEHRLKQVQDVLGAYNDEQVALAQFRERAPAEPNAWFAVGWLTARRDAQAAACAKALRALARTKPFWE